jgi:hypothetical protein
VSDGALSATRTFVLTVEASNDAPTIAAPNNASTPEDSSLVFSQSNSNALRLADVDAPESGLLDLSLSLQTPSGAASGTLTLAQLTGLTSPAAAQSPTTPPRSRRAALWPASMRLWTAARAAPTQLQRAPCDWSSR